MNKPALFHVSFATTLLTAAATLVASCGGGSTGTPASGTSTTDTAGAADTALDTTADTAAAGKDASATGGACPTPTGVKGSCNFGAQCANYMGTAPSASQCPAPGKLSSDPCPTTKVAGCCRNGQGTADDSETVYYLPLFSNASGAKADCDSSKGTWSTP